MSIVLSEHLPLLASAPDGILKLRGLILELAVRGKLVPQNPDDEPASELLKRITKERARLETEGVCKKSKSLPPLSENEKPFALPHAWAWTRLGEITNFGQTDKDGEISDTTWVLDLEDIQKDTSVLLQKVRFSERQAKSDKNRFKEGDVLYGKLRPYLNKVIVADEEGVCTTEILPVRGYLGIFPRYLMYAVKRPDFLAYVNDKSYGMKMPRLGTDDGRLALFPLAPEKEQHRIVAKVDELMALCDRLEAEQADAASAHTRLVETLLGTLTQSTDADDLATNWQRLAEHFDTLFVTEASIDALKQAVLQLAVMGKLVPQDPSDEPASTIFAPDKRLESLLPHEIPRGWTLTGLSNLAEINGGFAFKSTDYTDNGMRVVRISDFDELGFKNHKVVRHPFSQELSRFSLAEDNILMAMTGGTVGKSYLVKVLPEPMIVNQRVATIKVLEGACPTYVDIVIRAEGVQAAIRKAKNSTNDNISMSDIKGFAIPLPPIAEQRRIVSKVDELMALCDNLKADIVTACQHQTTLTDTLIESALEAV